MTYLDKFRQDHPNEKTSRFSGLPIECPHHYGYPVTKCKQAEYNPFTGPLSSPCWDCWHSEFPEREEQKDEPAKPMTVKQVKIFYGADDDTYGAIETKINEFLKTIPAEKVVDIRVTETDGKFTVTVVYETETRDEIQMSNSRR